MALFIVSLTAAFGQPALQAAVWILLMGLTAAAWWLRRRDRLAYERALADEAAARAVAEDRLAIAREVHDAVSGSLGAITVRAAIAQRLETEPERLLVALGEVEQVSREATEGLRHVVEKLRGGSPSVDAGPGACARGPGEMGALPGRGPARPGRHGAPGLVALVAGLASRAERGGLSVETVVDLDFAHGAPMIPALCWRAIESVVSEALSNTLRHAGPGSVTVALRHDEALLHVSVTDAGPIPGWQPHRGTGTGLDGVRERVRAAGGSLRFGERDDGMPGFAVEARLPMEYQDRRSGRQDGEYGE